MEISGRKMFDKTSVATAISKVVRPSCNLVVAGRFLSTIMTVRPLENAGIRLMFLLIIRKTMMNFSTNDAFSGFSSDLLCMAVLFSDIILLFCRLISSGSKPNSAIKGLLMKTNLCFERLNRKFAAAVAAVVVSVAGYSQSATRVITDFGGYWSSDSGTNTVIPNDRHNLLAFQVGSTIYATGVDNAKLTANGVVFSPTNFRGFQVSNIVGNVPSATNLFLVFGRATDGNPNAFSFTPALSGTNYLSPQIQGQTTRTVLSDGEKGLDIGTGVTNIANGVTITMPLSCVNPSSLADTTPDILLVQIADPSSADNYYFVNAAGNRVGSIVSPAFSGGSIGRYYPDFFSLKSNEPYNTSTAVGNGNPTTATRDIRLAAYTFADFGITTGNVNQIAGFKYEAKGSGDPAFFAYNEGSISVTPNETSWVSTGSTDWNTGSNWFCGVVPTATVSATIPTFASAVYPELNAGTGSVNNLNIASGASVTVSNNGNLSIYGAVTKNGTFNAVTGGVTYAGTSATNIPANFFETNFIRNLTVNNLGGVTLEGALNLTGVLRAQAGTFNAGGFLTLKSNAATTAMVDNVTGAITGNVIAERYLPPRRAFRFIGSTVDGGSIYNNWQEGGSPNPNWGTDITGNGGNANGFDESISNNPSLFTYNNAQSGNGWAAVANTNATNLVAGVPYRMLVRGDRTIDLTDNEAVPTATTLRATGTLKTGNVPFTNLSPTDDLFSLVANPYHAPVNMQTVLAASNRLDQNFYYVWDPQVNTRGAYVTVDVVNNANNVSGSVVNRYAQPGQAFFVKTIAGAGLPSITFQETSKHVSTTTPNQWRIAADDAVASSLRMTLYEASALANNIAADGFVLTFGSDYSNGIDSRDARKPSNQDENMGMLLDGTLLSYQSRNNPVSGDVIPMKNTQYRHTSYVYRAEVNNVSMTPYLFDKFTQTYHELTVGTTTEIPFTVDAANTASVASDRFDIVFNAPLSVDGPSAKDAFSVYPNPVSGNQFQIRVPSEGKYAVTLSNVLGQDVRVQVQTEGDVLTVSALDQLATGIYNVTVSNGSAKVAKKLIVN